MSTAHLCIPDKISLFSAIGSWIAALGTLCAVAVSIYLARIGRIIKIRVSAGHRVLASGVQRIDCCVIRAVNTGFRKVTITGTGWKVGFLRKQFYETCPFFLSISSPMPITLADAEEAAWHVPFLSTDGHPNWIDDFSEKTLGKCQFPKMRVRTLRIFVYTSVGKVFMAPIEKSLSDRLLRHLNEKSGKTDGDGG